MNRRNFFKAGLAALALTTGLAKASLGLVGETYTEIKPGIGFSYTPSDVMQKYVEAAAKQIAEKMDQAIVDAVVYGTGSVTYKLPIGKYGKINF